MEQPAPGDFPRSGSVLHVGCGGDPLPAWLACDEEVRLDIDPRHRPHIIADMRDLGDIGPFDLVFSSHSLEHLYPHEVVPALSGFLRVLRPGGLALVIVPDLEDVRPTEDVIFEAPCGPVTGLDLIYGLRSALAEMPHMAHHTGFVRESLEIALLSAGFGNASVRRDGSHNLIGVAVKA